MLFLARRHSSEDGRAELQRYEGRVRPEVWPAPIVDYFLGRISATEVTDRTTAMDDREANSQLCEVNFYLGVDEALKGNLLLGRTLLVRAQSLCPENYLEHQVIRTELAWVEKRLK